MLPRHRPKTTGPTNQGLELPNFLVTSGLPQAFVSVTESYMTHNAQSKIGPKFFHILPFYFIFFSYAPRKKVEVEWRVKTVIKDFACEEFNLLNTHCAGIYGEK
jgi:hypothetical protein